MESKDRKPRGFWTYDKCYNEALKYKSKKDFYSNDGAAYKAAYKNGWLKIYTWFERPPSHNLKWTRESCYNEAKQYKTRAEFAANNGSAYAAARKNGWLNDYTWFLSEFDARSKGTIGKGVKWTQERCREEALKYTSQRDFYEGSKNAYYASYRNGWLKDYAWFVGPTIPDKPIYVVYRYYDKESNTIYVGLAKNMKRRHYEHCHGFIKHGERKYDVVNRFFDSIGKAIPEPTILKDNLFASDAQKYEGLYIDKYKNEGFNVLNLAKAGSLGGLGKWSKEKCFDEAQKYDSRSAFSQGSHGAYKAALANGWMDDYTWFEKLWEKKWDYESCYSEAQKYKSRSEFDTNNAAAYNAARKNGWLKDYTWFAAPKTTKKWNRDTCFKEAQKYKTRSQFKNGSIGAYTAARKNGWLDDYNWFLSEFDARSSANKVRWKNRKKSGR